MSYVTAITPSVPSAIQEGGYYVVRLIPNNDVYQLHYDYSPAGPSVTQYGTPVTLSWSSTDTSVVTVDQDGVITSHAAGLAYITATDVNDATLTMTYKVYVTGLIPADGHTALYPGEQVNFNSSPFANTITLTSSPAGIVTFTTPVAYQYRMTAANNLAAVSNVTATITSSSGASYSAAFKVLAPIMSDPTSSLSYTFSDGITKLTAPTGYTQISATYPLTNQGSLPVIAPSTSLTVGLTLPAGVDASTLIVTNPNTTFLSTTKNSNTNYSFYLTASANPPQFAYIYIYNPSGTYYACIKTRALRSWPATASITAISPINVPTNDAITTVNVGPGNELEVYAYGYRSSGASFWIDATFTSSDPSIATVSRSAYAKGLIQGVSPGTVTITATASDTKNGTFTSTRTFTVQSVAVTGVNDISGASSVEVGSTITLSTSVTPADASNKTITWSSDATGVATVDSSTGVVTGVAVGTATITATSADGSYTKTKSVTVFATVSVTGVNDISGASTVAVGSTITLSASVTPADATNKTITWSSGATEVATVDASGVVTGVSAGTATITATSADGSYTKSKSVTVVVPVTGVNDISGASSVVVGSTITLSTSVSPADATNKTITWSSSSTGVATVDASGVVTGVSGGTAIITATSADGSYTKTKSVTVTVPVTGVSDVSGASTVAVGSSITLSASVTPGNATNQTITWSSGATGVATVDASGVVTGVSAGTATITATSADGSYTKTKSVTVVVPVTSVNDISGASSVVVGSTITLSTSVSPADATNKTITWSSGSTGVATVDASGVVTGVSAGTVTITATSADGSYTKTKSVTVTAAIVAATGVSLDESAFTKYVGQTMQLTATVSPPGASNAAVSWTSSAESVATVDASGLITAVSAGTATITATTSDGGFTASATATIIEDVSSVTLTSASGYNVLRVGGTLQLTPDYSPSGAVAVSTVWSSSDESIATVSSTGLVTCVATTATTGTNVVITHTVTTSSGTVGTNVTLAILYEFTGFETTTGFSVSDDSNAGYIQRGDEININHTQAVTFTALIPSNTGMGYDVSYSSSNTAVLAKQVDKYGNESNATFDVVGTGQTVISASAYGVTATQTVTVVDEPFVALTGFSVGTQNNAATTIAQGGTLQLVATPVPAGASYSAAYWSIVSSTSTGATVDPITGLLTAGSTDGEVVVRASYDGGIAQDFTVSVSIPPVAVTGLSNITAAGGLTYVAPGSTLQLSATISPPEASNKTINWTSSDTTKATVSSTGLVTGVALASSVTITATSAADGSYVKTYDLRIGVPVSGIEDISGASSILKNATARLTCSVSPANAAVTTITWSSSNSSVASVDSSGVVTAIDGGTAVTNAAGVVTGVSGNTATITATSVEGGYSATHDVTVTVLPTGVSGITDPSGNSRFIDVPRGGSRQLYGIFEPSNATNQSMTWVSSNTAIATIDASGVITGVAKGTCGVRGRSTYNSNMTSTATITVYIPVSGMNPITHSGANDQLVLGSGVQLSCAGVIPSDADNKSYSWSSSHPDFVVVDSRGYVAIRSAMPENEFTITATSADGGFTATKTFTVYRPLGGVSPITAPGRAIAVGVNNTLQLTLPLLPSNATTQTVTWTSSNPSKISISPTGLCTGVEVTGKKETITITASITEPLTNTTFTRTYPMTCPIIYIQSLSAISIFDSSGSRFNSSTLIHGNSYRFETAINPVDASYRNMGITWSVSDPANASIDSSGNLTFTGYPKALKVFATTVSTNKLKKANRTLKVVVMPTGFQSPITTNTGSFTVNPKKTIILKPVILPLQATNRKLIYTSSNPAVATVTTSGTVKGVALGSTTITITSAVDSSITTTVTVTVA